MTIDEFFEAVENGIDRLGVSQTKYFRDRGVNNPSAFFSAKYQKTIPSARTIIACEDIIGKEAVIEILKLKRSQGVSQDERNEMLIDDYVRKNTDERTRKMQRRAFSNAVLATAWEMGL